MLNFLFYRDNDQSFANGVLSESHYEKGKAKRLTSLNVCFTGWLTEVLLVISLGIALAFKYFGFNNVVYPFFDFINVITRFIVLPLIHMIMCDEHAKGIIREENWYEAVRYVFGIYNKAATGERDQDHDQN